MVTKMDNVVKVSNVTSWKSNDHRTVVTERRLRDVILSASNYFIDHPRQGTDLGFSLVKFPHRERRFLGDGFAASEFHPRVTVSGALCCWLLSIEFFSFIENICKRCFWKCKLFKFFWKSNSNWLLGNFYVLTLLASHVGWIGVVLVVERLFSLHRFLRQTVLSDIRKSYISMFCEQMTLSSQIAGFSARFVKKVLDNSE
jgi:hypothetical protein